jgi:glutamate carboxypeptidase
MDWRAYFTERQKDITSVLRQLVEIESPTTDKAAVDRVGVYVADQLHGLGAAVDISAQAQAGDHVVATWPAGAAGGAPVVMLFHMDTVWPLGTLATMPWSEEGDILRGPGVQDMKAGSAIVLAVLRAMRETGTRPARPIRLLFTSDEETGSLTSRALIEAEARKAALVLCLEPALPDGSLKTARKGVGEFVVTAHGRAAHAGADHGKGVNAIEDLAHQVIAIQRLTDYKRGITFNVGTITGGTADNVVPDRASMQIDIRVEHLADAEVVAQQLAALKPALAGTRLEVSGGLNRPPMERTPLIAATFERARFIAAGIGIKLSEGATGGGSDANFTAALDVPTLDGLGAVGNGGHSPDEYVLASSLPQRAALLMALLTQW